MNASNFEHNAPPEVEILSRAMEAMGKALRIDPKAEISACLGDDSYGSDYAIKARINDQDCLWFVTIKTKLTQVTEFLMAMSGHEDRTLLVTDYVSPEAAERLRTRGIQFIDTVGNAFLSSPGIFVFVKGNKRAKEDQPSPHSRLFRSAGLRLIYLMLCRNDLINRPYRELATMAGVSLGTVPGIMTEMARKEFLLDMGNKGRKLLNVRGLFQGWVEAYPEHLKPKLRLGRFRSRDDNWVANADMNWTNNLWPTPAVAQIGGELAAARLTHYLKPQTLTFYTDRDHLSDVVTGLRLRSDPKGSIEIYQRFWPYDQEGFGIDRLVHPILIYADLLAVGDQRTQETARMVYEQSLSKYFK